MNMISSVTLAMICGIVMVTASAGAPPLTYEGEHGPGQGKQIVFLAGDHEYRSEESLPALARILAKHHGFRCTVLFTVDPKSGEIVPGSNYMPGMEALDTADLAVVFLRFQDFPAQQMRHFASYLDRGGPVIGMRTATHAFKIPQDSPYARFSFRYAGSEFKGGFGRQVLGETWAGHYGRNHAMSTRLDLVPAARSHPILKGVTRPWVQAGAYWTSPMPGSTILAMAQPLNGMKPSDSPVADKPACPGAWVREYKTPNGKPGRVFTTTYGASEDLLNDDFRRMMVNACYWAAGLESKIKPDAEIAFVGPYHPSTFRFGGFRQHVLPRELADMNSPIMPLDKPIVLPKKRARKKSSPKRKGKTTG